MIRAGTAAISRSPSAAAKMDVLHELEHFMRLRDLREDRDITQRTIADYLHIGQNTYSQYETGRRQLPLDILIRLARYFHTSTDYILGLTDEIRPYPDGTSK